MAIAIDQNYDKAQRKISTNNLAQFAGVDCQLLVEKETHRPVIMDGSTIGGKFKCASTDEVKAVETVANNAISQAYADEHYLGKTAEATSATKATQDASGNVITNTYATKTELSGYLPISGGTLTGSVNGVTPSANDNSTKLATTAFVKTVVTQNKDTTATQILQAFQDFADKHGITVPETTDTTEGK